MEKLMMQKLLIVDDEKVVRESYVKALEVYGFSSLEADSGSKGIELFESNPPSAVLLDLQLPDQNGLDILKTMKKINAQIPIIMITGYGDISVAVEAIKLGAYDFVPKSPELEKLVVVIKRAIESFELKKQVQELDSTLDNSFEWMLGKSKPMQKIIKQIKTVAQSNFSIIIEGDTGTGKTYIASVIHSLSQRANKPFVKVDIGAIPETLVESELFGYEKGAFTGADNKKKGFFLAANQGTLFIDELENMSPHIQVKLLQVAEDKKFYPVGSTILTETDVRIIAATNVDIKKSVRENKLREDLFYRLGEFLITIPPLKERVEDIHFLALKFLNELNNDLDKNIVEISDEALNILCQYSWPGNVRELKTVIKKAVLFTDDNIIRPEHIEFLHQAKDEPISSTLSLKEITKNIEIQTIKQALKIVKGNKSRAAPLLDISYKTLLTKLKDYNLV